MTDAHVAAAALVATPGMTPARYNDVLERWPDWQVAYDRVVRNHAALKLGTPPTLAAMARVLAARATRVLLDTDDDFPIRDPLPDRPRVLLCEGAAIDALTRPRVAIVGTRAATPAGLADARALGAWCARRNITTVSGLALGIDGAAHAGTIDAGGASVGVIATGLDVVYPRRHATLYAAMRERGLLVTESALGTRPHAGRFPVRNRIIAGLADVVVVIEATISGGARITADLALEYNRPVFAMPGARRNPAAAGCNALLADGAHALLDPTDLLPTLGESAAPPEGWADRPTPSLSPHADAVLAACAGEPLAADALVARTGIEMNALTAALHELERAQHIVRQRGIVHPLTPPVNPRPDT